MQWRVYKNSEPYHFIGLFDDYAKAVAKARECAALSGKMYCVRRCAV